MLAKIIIDSDGSIRFYNEHGVIHRHAGPAVINAIGSKVWYINGKCHRLDGPACEYADGTKRWFINGNEYLEEEFNEYVGEIC